MSPEYVYIASQSYDSRDHYDLHSIRHHRGRAGHIIMGYSMSILSLFGIVAMAGQVSYSHGHLPWVWYFLCHTDHPGACALSLSDIGGHKKFFKIIFGRLVRGAHAHKATHLRRCIQFFSRVLTAELSQIIFNR